MHTLYRALFGSREINDWGQELNYTSFQKENPHLHFFSTFFFVCAAEEKSSTCFVLNTKQLADFSSAAQIQYLTNRFHVAVRLFSNRSQMTSKCGKKSRVCH